MEGVVILKELIVDIFHFGRPWINFFLGGCGGLVRTDVGLFLLWRECGCLECTDFGFFYFKRVLWT